MTTKRLARIAVITDIHYEDSGAVPPRITADKDYLIRLFSLIKKDKPDCLVDMGDVTTDTTGTQKYEECWNILKSIGVPCFTVLGNHDTGGQNSVGSVPPYSEKIFRGITGLSRTWSYDNLHPSIKIIGLNYEFMPDDTKRISAVDQKWLEEQVKEQKNILVFSHMSLADLALKDLGVYRNQTDRNRTELISNRTLIRAILAKGTARLIGAFSGHLHETILKRHEKIPFLTVQPSSQKTSSGGPADAYVLIDVYPDHVSCIIKGNEHKCWEADWPEDQGENTRKSLTFTYPKKS